MRRTSFFLFFVSAFFIQKSCSVLIIYPNHDCPQYERYKNPDPWYIRFKKYCFKELTYQEGFFYYSMPQEVINAADKSDKIEVDAYDYQLLKNESERNKKYFNSNNIITLMVALIKKKLGLSYRAPAPFQKVPNELKDKKICVTESDIISIFPFVQQDSMVLESWPPQYTFFINSQAERMGSKMTVVLSDYKHFTCMLQGGWIRCSGPGIYFHPRYFKESADYFYCRYYGPRFREVICPNDPPHGKLVWEYDFKKDPETMHYKASQRLIKVHLSQEFAKIEPCFDGSHIIEQISSCVKPQDIKWK